MWKDSQVRRSKLKYSYPSIQFSHRMNHHTSPYSLWLKLCRDSLPFPMSIDENIQMNQQIDMILRRSLKGN